MGTIRIPLKGWERHWGVGGGGGKQSHPHCNLEVAALTSSKEI